MSDARLANLDFVKEAKQRIKHSRKKGSKRPKSVPKSGDPPETECDAIDFPPGDAVLDIDYRDGSHAKVDSLLLETIYQKCPLLALAFEPSSNGSAHSMDKTSPQAVAALLRYAYGLAYKPADLESCQMTFVHHLESYLLASRYDVQELQTTIHGHIIWECELSCSVKDPPDDLVPGIRFLYTHLADDARLVDTFTRYCVTNFLTHKLFARPSFRQLAYEKRQFQQDLCRVCRDRDFADEAAPLICSLPVNPDEPDPRATPGGRMLGDCIYETFNDTADNSTPTRVPRHDKLPLRPSSPPLRPLPAPPSRKQKSIAKRLAWRELSTDRPSLSRRGLSSTHDRVDDDEQPCLPPEPSLTYLRSALPRRPRGRPWLSVGELAEDLQAAVDAARAPSSDVPCTDAASETDEGYDIVSYPQSGVLSEDEVEGDVDGFVMVAAGERGC